MSLASLENPHMRIFLCLFEGVATGAADGWYRMKDTPASTLFHLRSGLANGVDNLHNAKSTGSGIVNIIGEHANAHLKYDAPLMSDIEGIARPVSSWVHHTDTPHSLATDAAMAIYIANFRLGHITTLILPGETSWGDTGEVSTLRLVVPSAPASPSSRVEHIASILRSGEPTLFVLGGRVIRGRLLELAGRVIAHSNCRVATQFFSARIWVRRRQGFAGTHSLCCTKDRAVLEGLPAHCDN